MNPGQLRETCYALSYGGSDPPLLVPDRIALHAGADSGRAVWLPSARQREGVQVMVGRDGTWRRTADSLVVMFTTPYIRTDIELRGTGDTLRGRADGMSDGAIGVRTWRAVTAVRSACR